MRQRDLERALDRLPINELLAVPDVATLRAGGDSAVALDGPTASARPTTAPHALREGRTAAQNIASRILGRPSPHSPIRRRGQLAIIGRRMPVVWCSGRVLRLCGLAALVNGVPDDAAAPVQRHSASRLARGAIYCSAPRSSTW